MAKPEHVRIVACDAVASMLIMWLGFGVCVCGCTDPYISSICDDTSTEMEDC